MISKLIYFFCVWKIFFWCQTYFCNFKAVSMAVTFLENNSIMSSNFMIAGCCWMSGGWYCWYIGKSTGSVTWWSFRSDLVVTSQFPQSLLLLLLICSCLEGWRYQQIFSQNLQKTRYQITKEEELRKQEIEESGEQIKKN